MSSILSVSSGSSGSVSPIQRPSAPPPLSQTIRRFLNTVALPNLTPIPNMPKEYSGNPLSFFRNHVRILSLVPVGDGSWTPMLGVTGLQATDEVGGWTIMRKTVETTEDFAEI
jgi:hypothetical protein